MDRGMHSAYVLGRRRMAAMVSSVFNAEQSNQSKIEEQVIEFMDQLYEA